MSAAGNALRTSSNEDHLACFADSIQTWRADLASANFEASPNNRRCLSLSAIHSGILPGTYPGKQRPGQLPITDKTGLKGHYDFKLEWTPQPGIGPVAPGVSELPPSGDNSRLSGRNTPAPDAASQSQTIQPVFLLIT